MASKFSNKSWNAEDLVDAMRPIVLRDYGPLTPSPSPLICVLSSGEP